MNRKTFTENSKKHAGSGRNILAASFLALVMTLSGVAGVFADSASMAEDGFDDTITHSGEAYVYENGAWKWESGSDKDTANGVRQSDDRTSPYLTFGSAMPLSTIYIDTQSFFNNDNDNPWAGEFAWESSNRDKGLKCDYTTGQNARPYFDPTEPGAKKLLASSAGAQGNYFAGPLYSYTFKGAATLPDGTPANVKIIYSNMHLYVDKTHDSVDTNGFQDIIRLPYHNDITFGTDTPTTNKHRSAGVIDARIQIVDDNGKPVDGTFIYAMNGLNVYRGSTNYSLIAESENNNWFSEGVRVNSGTVSDIYVRSKEAQSTSGAESGDNNKGFWPTVSNEVAGAYEGAVRFDAITRYGYDQKNGVWGYYNNTQGNNNSYQTGFVTTADAASGISLTGQNTNVNTWLSKGAIMWHRIRSVSGPGGSIKTTTEGNEGGTLNDKSDNGDNSTVLDQGTYVVPDGKKVTYTMTPDQGYVLHELRINNSITQVPTVVSGLDTLKDAGDTLIVTLNDGKQGVVTKLADGSYTFDFPYNNADHTIMVTWIPDTTENVSVDATKKWYDKNNAFQKRKNIIVHVNGEADYGGGESYHYPADFLPAQLGTSSNNTTVADGNEAWIVSWGDGEKNDHGYTGAEKGEQVFAKLTSPGVPTADSGGNTYYWFYDYSVRKFRAYTYNSTTGKFIKTDETIWVNFLPKYDESGKLITYTVEEEVPDGYSLTVTTNNSGTASQTMADFDYTLKNTLEPVGTVKVKATKALDGRPYNGTDEFVFVLSGKDGAPMPVGTAVKIPAEGEDTAADVVKTVKPTANTVLTEADFGVISYRRSDLTATKITYGTPSTEQTNQGYVAANAEQKDAARYWTVKNVPTTVDKTDDRGYIEYKDSNNATFYYDSANNKLYDSNGDEVTGFDINNYTKQTVTTYADKTFDMLDTNDTAAFNALDSGLKDSAAATAYERVFEYVVTENPKHPDYVENDENTYKMTVRVFYNEKENKIYIEDEDRITTNNGVTDITAETTTALTTPAYTLHRDFFTNVYDNKVTWEPEITKTLNGRPIKKDQFKDYFTIKAVDTTETINAQIKNKVVDTETPMPGGPGATGKYPHGGTVASKTQEIESASSVPKGTNDVKAIVGFDGITYTNEDLKKEIYYNSATDAQKNRVIEWTRGSNVYGPIPAGATASVTQTDGSKASVTYDNATDAQREEAKSTGWSLDGKTFFDLNAMTTAEQSTALSGSQGYYYLDSRKFTYKIWESGTAKDGYTNDTAHDSEDEAYEVEVTVTRDNTTGKLSVTQNKTVANLAFENKYEAKGLANLKANKVLNGRKLNANEFTFTVTPKNGAPAPENTTVGNKADGTIDFGNITFTQEHFKSTTGENPGAYDAVRTEKGYYEKDFVYEITETAKNTDGLTSDTKKITCVITVREDDKGNITVVAVNGNTAADASLKTSFNVDQAAASTSEGVTTPASSTVNAGEFTNKYNATGTTTISGTKTLNGGKLNANDFYFELIGNARDKDGKPVADSVLDTQPNKADGTITFRTIPYNLDQVKADATNGVCTHTAATETEAEYWTYTYKIKEVQADNRSTDDLTYDTHEETVTVKVTDNGNGTLAATTTYDADGAAFTNTVKYRSIEVRKIWIDNDADGISNVNRPTSVTVQIMNGNAVASTITLTGNTTDSVWSGTVYNLPVYDASGNKITYTVREPNVPANYKVSYIQNIYTVVNTYEITEIKGTKKWVDGGKAHAISADLDGKLTVKWTDAGGSSGAVSNPHIDYDNTLSEYKVIGLPKYSDDGDLRTYYVEETQLSGYKEPAYDNSASSDTSLTPEQKAEINRAYNGGTITNTIDGKINVTGTKVWKDDTDSPSAPATTPTLTLTRISAKSGSTEETVQATATWNTAKTEYTFSNLDKYDSEGYEYTYKVTETAVPGYLPPQYSDGTYAANGGTITNIKEPTGKLDIPVTKIMTGSTRISEWNFELSLKTGINGGGDTVVSSKTVPAGTLSADGLSESSDVSFDSVEFRIVNLNGTETAQMKVKDGPLSTKWVNLTSAGNGRYTTKLYVYETPITATGLTQPSDGGTPVDIVVTNNNDGTLTAHVASGVTAGDVLEDYNDGTVLAEADTASAKVQNKHEQTVDANIAVKKTLTGRDLKANDAFSFTATYQPDTTLSAEEQARLKAGLSAETGSVGISGMSRGASTADATHPYGTGNSASGNIPFTFSKTGTYKFKVTETGSVPGVTNDTKDGEIVTITVTKKNDGTLDAAVSYADGSDADFTNAYDAKGDAKVIVRKLINGEQWTEDMNFWFNLEPLNAPQGYDTNTMPKPSNAREAARLTNNDATNHRATWNFGEFTLADSGKAFVYKVTESTPNFAGFDATQWDLDITKLPAGYHTVKVVPKDKGDGTMDFDLYYDNDTTAASQPLQVTNRKHGQSRNIYASKQVVDSSGRSHWPSAIGTFELVLTGKDGAPMPDGSTGDTKKVTVSDTTQVNFDAIDFRDEYTALNDGDSKTFTYEITETVDATKTYIDWGIDDTSKFTVEVTIAKDSAGTAIDPKMIYRQGGSDGTVIYDSTDPSTGHYPVIKNKYTAEGEIDLELTKSLDGGNLEAGDFGFTLYDASKRVVKDKDENDIKGKVNAANGKVTLGTLKFTDADVENSPITYNIREDIPVGAKAQDDESIVYAADTILEVRDAHVWVKDGVRYDPSITHPVTITLSDNADGTIDVIASTANVEGSTGDKLTVTNYYEAEGKQTFKVYKYLEERPIRRAGFTFELKRLDGAPMPAGVTGDTTTTQVLPSATYSHSGDASFADIVYTMDDLKKQDGTYETSKTFEYEIREIPASTQGSDGLTYADIIYKAAVTVSNADKDGVLDLNVTYTRKSGTDSKYGDNTDDAKDTDYGDNGTLDFTNIYDSDGSATMNLAKTILGRAWQDSDKFKLKLEPLVDGASYIGGGTHKTDITDATKIPLPGNTIDQDHRELPGNSSTGNIVEVNGTDQALGGASHIKTTDEIKFTDDMLTYDSADGYLKGVFIYKVTEDTVSLPAGFTQTDGSTKTYYVRIDVLDDRMGNLETTVSYYDSENKAKNATDPIGTAPIFSNTYDADVKNVKIPVKKYVDVTGTQDGGWALLDDSDKFTFKATPVGSAPTVTDDDIDIAKTTTDHTNSFNIGSIKLSELLQTTTTAGQLKYSNNTDVPAGVSYGEFVGLVEEEDHNINGVDKDETSVYVKLTAIDKLNGTIDTQIKFYSDISCLNEITTFTRSAANDIEFVNVYRDVIDVEVGKTWHDAADAEAVAARPAIKIQLTRQTEGGNVEILTRLDGNAKLYAANGTTEINYANGEATVSADQLPVTFKNVPATDKDGNIYTYNVVETDAGTGYYQSKDPEVTQEGAIDDPETDEDESAIWKFNLTNTKTTKVHVEKTWKDEADSDNRGNVIVAALYRNGTLVPNNIKLVQSDSDPAWQTVFEDLPMYDDSDRPIDYTAREMAVPEEYYTSLVEYSLTGTAGSWSTTKPENWNTDAEKYVRITNILLTTLEVEKEWAGIPTDNVTYELYRTTGTPDDITDGDWNPEQPNADDSTWEKVMASDGTTPLTHTFRTEEFYDDNGDLKDPEVVKYTFTDLERYDKNGTEYKYRVFESTGGPYFESEQVSNVKVKNTNVYDGIGYAYPNVVKELEGRRWLDTDEFYFKIEPIKSIDDEGKAVEFTDSDEDQATKAKVPLPEDGEDADEDPDVIAKADVSKKVGAIGRSVDFNRIKFVSGDGEAAHVTEGGSADYYYMIYEVDKDGNKIGGETSKGITYTDAVHTLKVHLEDDGLGKVTTQRYWDGADTSSAVPVYVNTYKAYGISYGYVIKRIAGRDFKSGDEFTFEFTNLSGSPVRRGDPDDPGTTEPTTGTVDPVGYEPDKGVYVSGTAGQYVATGGDSGADKAQEVGVNYINSGDLVAGSDGKLRGTFVYQFREIGGRSTDTITKVEDLEYDSNLIYLRVSVEDNEDGTLKVEHKYFLDAACTQELEGREKHEPLLLVDLATGDIAPAGAQPGTHTVTEQEAADPDSPYYEMEVGTKITYGYVASGYFRNRMKGDIPIAKKWVTEDENGDIVPTDPIDNVTVNLRRMAVFVNPQDGKYYNTYTDGVYSDLISDEVLKDFSKWDPVSTHVFEVGDFYFTATEATAYNEENDLSGDDAVSGGDLKPDPVDYVFKGVELYDHNAADGVPSGKIYIYRLREATGSEAYESTYRLGTSEAEIEEWIGTDTTGEKVTVVNKVAATNVANLAAVKQLMGRDWLSVDSEGHEVDRYKFLLTPVGMGTYDANGELVKEGGKVKMDEDVGTKIPMPDSVISSELNSLTEKDKALAAKVTRYADSSVLDAEEIVGEGERLARFGPIEFKLDDLVYDEKSGNMQGDFFYTMKEEIPNDALLLDSNGDPTSTTYEQATAAQKNGGKFFDASNGITYDSKIHNVHIRVTENRTEDLVVQVAYDEKTEGDISTGTQFTPVYTNSYTATGDYAVSVDKKIMGRKWEEGDKFDFSMQALGGAPFEDKYPASSADPEFAPDSKEDAVNRGNLDRGLAIHNNDGTEHVKRLIIDSGAAGTTNTQTLVMPTLKYKMSELGKTTTVGGQFKYNNGRDVPAGTKYEEFMYALEEENLYPADYPEDINLDDGDDDTEYVKVIAIDKGDGKLDFQVKVYEDRFGTYQRATDGTRYTDGSSKTPATHATFVNQALRDIKVVKTWKGEPVENAEIKLQYRLPLKDGEEDEGQGWEDYEVWTPAEKEKTENLKGEKISGLDLRVAEYEHIFENIPVYGDDGGDIDANDSQLEWRIIETSMDGVKTYYGVARPDGADAAVTEDAAPSADGYDETQDKTKDPDLKNADKYVEDLDGKLYVTNVHAPTGEATRKLSVVKELAGRDWMSTDEFKFTLIPIGMGTYNEAGELYMNNKVIDRTKLLKEGGEVYTDIPLPAGLPSGDAVATDAVDDEYKLTDSQRQAKFGDIKYDISDLRLIQVAKKDANGNKIYRNNETGEEVAIPDGQSTEGFTLVTEEIYMGDFVYDMVEVIPDTATGTLKSDGTTTVIYADVKDQDGFDPTLYTWKDGDIIYTTDKHDVHVHVDRQNGTMVTSVSYDGKETGGAVPVFVNEYDPATMDIPVTKTWVAEDKDKNLVPTKPIDNITVNIRRYAVFIGPNGKYYEDEEHTTEITLPDDLDEWDAVGTHTYRIGDFYWTQEEIDDGKAPDGTKAGDLKTDGVTNIFKGLETDEVKDGELTGRKYVYRVREATRSDAYDTSYTVGTGSEQKSADDWTGTDTTGDELGIVNKIEATNVANIAAVKQMVGRDWIDGRDSYEFKLTPVKGVIADGKSTKEIDVNKIPMPDDDDDTTTDDDEAKTDDDLVVGENERLARFAGIEFDLEDLGHNETTGRMEGDFYYTVAEVRANGAKVSDNGYITYDTKVHDVHVQVRENRTGKLEVIVAYDEETEGDVESGTQFTPVFVNRYADTDMSVRKVWAGDTDIDGTAKATRPDKIGIQLQSRVTTYTYDNVDYATKAEAVAVAKKAGGTEADVTTTVGDWTNVGTWRDTEGTEHSGAHDLVANAENTNTGAAKADDDWVYKYENMPVRTATAKGVGSVSYQVIEPEAPKGYRKLDPVSVLGTTVLTNVYQGMDFTGTKVWVDGGQKHDNVTELTDHLTLERYVTVYTYNGEDYDTKAEAMTAGGDDSTITTSEKWKAVPDSDLHIHWNKDGSRSGGKYTQSFTITGISSAYDYRVVEDEDAVKAMNEDYVTSYDNSGASAYTDKDDAIYNGGKVINKLEKKIEIEGNKIWTGGDDADHDNTGLDVELWRSSASVPEEQVSTIKVDGEDEDVTIGDWEEDSGDSKFYFGYDDATDGFTRGTLFDKYDSDGNEYTYTVKNETGCPDGYSPKYDGMTVTNALDATTVTVKPEFIKKASGMPQDVIDADGKTFTFALLPQTNHGANAIQNPDTTGKTVKVENNSADGYGFDFGSLTFDAAGQYKYKLIEQAEDGWTTDRQVTEFTIEVTDDNGVLSAEIKWPQGATTKDDKLVVTNTYSPKTVTSSIDIDLKKELEGRTLNAEEFSFTMKGLSAQQAGSGYKDATGKDAAGTNKKDGSVKMSSVSFSEVGKYAFEVTEDVPATKAPGMTYAATKYRVEAVVTGASDGTLSVDWNILEKDGASTSDREMTFKNTYDNLKIEENIYLKKILEGRKLKADEFEFVLAGDDTTASGNQGQQTVENTAGGDLDGNKKSTSEAFKFDNKIPFTLEDLCDHDGDYIDHDDDGVYSREFTYKVFEKPGTLNGVTYDGTVHELKATLKYIKAEPAVEDDPETTDVDESKPAVAEHLEVSWTLDGSKTIDFEKATPDTIDFKNSYDPDAVSSSVTDEVDVTKHLEVPTGQSRNMLKDEFIFELLDEENNRVAIGTNKTDGQPVTGDDNDSEAAVSIAPITFTKDMVADDEWETDATGDKTGTKGASYAELTYKIKEIKGNNEDDLVYDKTTRTVKAILIENNGTLQVKWVKSSADEDYVFTNSVPPETVDKPVRVTWINDTDTDGTVGVAKATGTDGVSTNVSKDRPTEVTVTLQAEVTRYVYKGNEYPTEEEAKAAADTDQGKDPGEGDYTDITTVKKWQDVTKKANGDPVPASITLDEDNNIDGDVNNWGDDSTWTGLPKRDSAGDPIKYENSIIGTDHAPHTLEDKTKGVWSSSPGIPNLETVVPLLLTEVNNGNIDLKIIPKILSENAAKVYGLENKGKIDVNMDADFTVIDLKRKDKFNIEEFKTKAEYSPFDGWEYMGMPIMTIVNGKVVMDKI